MGSDRDGRDYLSSSRPGTGRIGKRSLEELRETFRHELFDLSIPLWRRDGVDWESGGYATSKTVDPADAAGWPYLDDAGNVRSANKKLYHQGRILWLYSHLYNQVEKDDCFLRAATNGYEFLDSHCRDDTYNWMTEVTREGACVVGFHNIIANIYMTLGLAEYYRATRDSSVLEAAKKSAYRIAEILYSNHYQAEGHSPFYPVTDSYREPGTRRLGYWLHYLNALSTLLRYSPDSGLEKIARNVVRNILRHHYREDLKLPYEFLQRDFTPYPRDYLADDYLRAVDGFHSIEAAWMTMDEALRVGSREMFREAMEMGRLLLEKTYLERDGMQGLVRFYWPDERDPFARSEILGPYVMKEVFVFLLLAVEHTGADWAVEWMDRTFSYSYETPIRFPYMDTLHNVRGLLFGLQILDRMIDRNGKVSDFLR